MQSKEEEDDWETVSSCSLNGETLKPRVKLKTQADISTFAPASKINANLRPNAPAFQPHLTGSSNPTTGAGLSNVTPSGIASSSASSSTKPKQRVHVPPGNPSAGRSGVGFNIPNQAQMRADWDSRAGNGQFRTTSAGGKDGRDGGDGGDEWFRAGQRSQTNRQLWDEA